MEWTRAKSSETRLQFYSVPPNDSVSLDVVENLAVERLKVLRCIESVSQDFIKGSKEYDENLNKQLRKCSDLGKSLVEYPGNSQLKSISSDIKRDVLSHFLLQVAYCRTEDLSRWFIQQEIDLFKFRFNLENLNNPNCISKFMNENNIKVDKASPEECKRIEKFCPKRLDNVSVYKVRPYQVLDSLKLGQVYVENGFAYLFDNNLVSLISSHFRANLSHSLSFMRLQLQQLDEDSRLMPILSTLNKRYTGKDYSEAQNSKVINAAQINVLSKKSFPPCMQKLHTSLLRDHHLKHWGRMQYGLFLKGIGLPLEESLKFWKNSFQEKVDSEAFAKKYAYSIRHNYGQEGKRTNYTPYSCVKIITTNPPQAGDCHGCPFQNSNLDLLVQNLKSTTKVTPQQIESIVDKANKKQYQISCRNYFKAVHDMPDDYAVTINHPNEYFEESQKLMSL